MNENLSSKNKMLLVNSSMLLTDNDNTDNCTLNLNGKDVTPDNCINYIDDLNLKLVIM